MSEPTASGDHEAALIRVEKELVGRWPESRIEWTLDRVRLALDMLGDPHLAYPVVHLAGTNGKTTTARMVDALLRQLSLRTGRFTSPHLESITERICLDGEPLSPEQFVAAYDDVAPIMALADQRLPIRLSFFEAVTVMAFAAFADAPVDVAVIEVGMGGRLDATNVVEAPVAVISPVSIDHTAYLGDTIEQIAGEKAGIIKAGQNAIIAAQTPVATAVLQSRAAEVGATALCEGIDFGVTERHLAVGGQLLTLRGLHAVYDEVFVPLHGEYQASNAACALAAVEALTGGEHDIEPDAVRAAFAGVRSPGRLEVVRSAPTVLIDASHNPGGAKVTAATLASEFHFTRLVGVIGIHGDKDVRGILEEFEPVLAHVVITKSSSHRAMPVDELAAVAVEVFGADRVDIADRLDEAIEVAVERAEERGDMAGAGVLVTGSVVTAGEARHLLGGRK